MDKKEKIRREKISKSQRGKNNNMYGMSGSLSPTSRKVISIESGKIYDSISECAEDNNVHFTTVHRNCKGHFDSQKFKYYEEGDENKIESLQSKLLNVHGNSTKVKCLCHNNIYESLKSCAEDHDKCRDTISKHLANKVKSKKFEYI